MKITLYYREPSNSESGNGDGGVECQASLTPHQQHQQYLGEHRPELDSFPDLEWEGQFALGRATTCVSSDLNCVYR